ncbi:MAG TPA: hypothetical protein VJR47_06455 [Stellaceae bacterium]|nr:hypothetical protein [Stellaceae bacterium]
MRFRVIIGDERDVIHDAVHDADGIEPALRDAMRMARRDHPGKPVYRSRVMLMPLDKPEG